MRRVAPTRAAVLLTAAAGALLAALLLFQQRTRTIEGTWIDLFEGSRFFEGEGLSFACRPKFWDAPWFAYHPKKDSEVGKLLEANRNSGVFISRYGGDPIAAYAVKFEGHHQILGLGFGHFGGSPSEYVVDRMISIKPMMTPYCDIRPG